LISAPPATEAGAVEPTIIVTSDGPYRVEGPIEILDPAGETLRTDGISYLCRCGGSRHKPFCDTTHAAKCFDGTETASRASYLDQAKAFDGPALRLTDAEGLCASARFCDPNGKVWTQVAHTDDPAVKAMFVRQVNDCPSGRLVAWDKATGSPVEHRLPVSIGLIEDPAEHCSGPIWLRGGIAVVSADGFEYEARNRMTLCRCAASKNKPFCDGAHASIKFDARKKAQPAS